MKIPNLKSFKKRLILRSGMSEETKDTTWIQNDYLTVEEMKNKLDEQKKTTWYERLYNLLYLR